MLREEDKLFSRYKDGMKMVYIPAGTFMMGSEVGYDSEMPVHEVYTDAFYIDEHTVTNAQYCLFLYNYGKDTDADWNRLIDIESPSCLIERSGNVYQPKSGYEKHPVVEVTWYGAAAYAEWVSTRLPTEAEWEKSARGGLVGKKYPWGDEIGPAKANYDNDGSRKWIAKDTLKYLKPVGSFPPNGYGLYDMVGNVWEWCADWYDEDYYENSPERNPKGPEGNKYSVCRGGSWGSNPNSVRCATRVGIDPKGRYFNLGFRCVFSSPT